MLQQQYITNDESLHHYGRRYQLILNRAFPEKIPLPYIRGMTNPFKINEKNRALLYKFYQHIEIEASLGLARRARVILLLSTLAQFLEVKSFDTLTKEDIQELITTVRQQSNWSLTTQNYHLKALKKFLKFLNGGDEYPPCISWLRLKERKNSPIKKEDLITEEEMGRILKLDTNAMHRCLFSLLWEGLRVGELGGLRCRNISFEGKEVYISVKGKTGDRTVLSVSGAPFIRQWMDQHPTQNPDDWLFVISSNYNIGKRLGYGSIRKIVQNGCEKAGIKNRRIHPHLFRHSSITDRRRKGMRQREASAFYGVSGQVMSQVYDHLADADVHNEIRRVLGVEKIAEPAAQILNHKSCPFCQKINPHYSTACLNCGNSLSQQDGLKQHDQFKTIENENANIKRELNALRTLMMQFTDSMKMQFTESKVMSPERLAQILQETKKQEGGIQNG